jgi:hypothetical protein
MFPHQTLDTCLSHMICIQHEFVSTPYSMIQFHLDFDTRRYAGMSFVCTKHSICTVTICYVSAPNSRCLCVRLASRVEHPGGFGTCVPEAGLGHSQGRPFKMGGSDPHGASYSPPERDASARDPRLPDATQTARSNGPGFITPEQGADTPAFT